MERVDEWIIEPSMFWHRCCVGFPVFQTDLVTDNGEIY